MNITIRTTSAMRLTILAAVLFASLTGSVLAHREDYLDETLVFETLEMGEFEPEYWFDYGHRSGGDFTRHHIAMEYGLTPHWMIDVRGTIENASGSRALFDSARFETRYRFFEEGTLPIDIAVSGDFSFRRREDGSLAYALEPRLILSKDFGKLNVTLNLAEEFALNGGKAAFEVGSGFRYNVSQLIRVGTELKYDGREREGAVIPQIAFAFPHDITLKAGFSAGFARSTENSARVVVEVEF